MDRRKFIAGAGLAVTGGALGLSCEANGEANEDSEGGETSATGANNSAPPTSDEAPEIDLEALDRGNWSSVRDQFNLAPDRIHYSIFLIASNPARVRQAISQHRRRLDEEPAPYLEDEITSKRRDTREAAANYVGGSREEIALTDSTTMGIGLVYNGLMLEPDDEIITTEHDYYSTHASLQFARERTGASLRRISLYDDPFHVTEEEVVSNVEDAITSDSRVLALTWVHSRNGVKLPIGAIGEVVAEANEGRDLEDRLLLCVDGVHGFGIENTTMDDLGCDFFMAGAHKWLFGPRGTGIVWGHSNAWAATRPIIPAFGDSESWDAWSENREPPQPTTAGRMMPGGFKPFEHQWAMIEAFEFHDQIGRERVATRTHELNSQLKEGMANMDHIDLYTPMSPELSSGMVCFDINGHSPYSVRDRLRESDIMATVTPYDDTHARLAPSIVNTTQEIETTLERLRALG